MFNIRLKDSMSLGNESNEVKTTFVSVIHYMEVHSAPNVDHHFRQAAVSECTAASTSELPPTTMLFANFNQDFSYVVQSEVITGH